MEKFELDFYMPDFIFKESIPKEILVETLQVLHISQKNQTDNLERIKGIANSWKWATENRGCYDWDDERFYKEFEQCLDNIVDFIDALLAHSNTNHDVCCKKYGHLYNLLKDPIQLNLDFGKEYPDFVDEITKLCQMSGRI